MNHIVNIGCEESLGVCFTIDARQIFCAYMCAGEPSKPISDAQGIALLRQVDRRLPDFAEQRQWDVEHENLGAAGILLCKRSTEKVSRRENIKYPSWWMAQGVKSFVKRRLIDDLCNSVEAQRTMRSLSRSGQGLEIPTPTEVGEEISRRLKMKNKIFETWTQSTRKVTSDGTGFVVDLYGYPQVKITLLGREGGRGLELVTAEVDTSSHVSGEGTLETGEWLFSLEEVNTIGNRKPIIQRK